MHCETISIEMTKFSVIVPLYNKAPYVVKALKSIVHQTFRDFELIVVDDGSTDGSAIIAENYLNEAGVNVSWRIMHQPNSGVSAARNNGVVASSGAYITFLDADDWWKPNFLEELTKLISDYPEAGMYATNYIYYKPGKTHVALDVQTGYVNYPLSYYHCEAMLVTSITVCIPRSVWDEMGGFPLGIMHGEDFLLWSKIALHHKVALTSEPLAYYNNDIPASMRATRNLYAPKYHMMFYFDTIEEEISQLDERSQAEWKLLLDRLRVRHGLRYWMSKEYRSVVKPELDKVDWSKQPRAIIRTYNMPRWLYQANQYVRKIGSYFKQKIIHCIYS